MSKHKNSTTKRDLSRCLWSAPQLLSPGPKRRKSAQTYIFHQREITMKCLLTLGQCVAAAVILTGDLWEGPAIMPLAYRISRASCSSSCLGSSACRKRRYMPLRRSDIGCGAPICSSPATREHAMRTTAGLMVTTKGGLWRSDWISADTPVSYICTGHLCELWSRGGEALHGAAIIWNFKHDFYSDVVSSSRHLVISVLWN